MGKATIIEHLGAGHYRINVQFENSKVEARLTVIDQQIADAWTEINGIVTKKDAAKSQLNADIFAVNEYIYYSNPNNFAEATPIDQNELARLQGIAYASHLAYDLLVMDEKRARLKKKSLEQEKVFLTRYCPKEFESYAWCVAYNENLTGIVRTIEVDYVLERDKVGNLIRNHTGFWLPDGVEAPDSQLQHPLATSEHATWFNIAMLPAMQKFKGRYRIATITSLNKPENKCNLYFDGLYNVDDKTTRLIDKQPITPRFDVYGAQQITYVDAPVEYMGGGAETFEIDDKVIVDLHNGVGVPTVIGYYENPRQGTKMYLLATTNEDYPQHWVTDIDVIDITGFHVFQDMVENANLYTIAFGIGSPVATSDPNGAWDNLHNILWIDGSSFFNLVNNTTTTFPHTEGRTITDWNYLHRTGLENTKNMNELSIWLQNLSEFTVYKSGIEYAHVKFYPQGSSLDVKTAFVIDQTGSPLFSELKDSEVKGYFKFTGSYVHDWTS